MVVVSFTGHRPKELFGHYDTNNPKARLLALKLTEQIEYLITQKEASVFYTAGAQGVDQIAFMCVALLKKKYPHIRNVVAVPYKDQPLAWQATLEKAKQNNWKKVVQDLETTLKRYEAMLQLADDVVYVDTLPTYQPKNMPEEQIGRHANAKLHLASVYMVDQSDLLVAVYNGNQKSGTYRCIEEAKKQNMPILYLDPNEDFKVKMSE